MPVVLIFGFLLIFVVVLVSVSLGLKFYETRRRKQVTEMLQTVSGPETTATVKILKDLEPPQPGLIEGLLSRLDIVRKVECMSQQAGMEWTATKLFTNMAAATIPGAILGFLLPAPLGRVGMVCTLALVTALIPYLYLSRKRKKRMAAMEEQLPEALDFLSRSMRAGHAFTISLEMLGEELPDPLGQEFRTLFNEHNLGAHIETAMKNFSERVPLLDVRFFCSAVLLQRQTGGNLSEILQRLSYLIRERFRLKGQVKAASAHGRITAAVLLALPIITMLGLMVVAPQYLQSMAKDPDGRWLIVGSIAAQVLGNYCIKKIVNIKV
ncbi:MAG: type II secretion system F family protein [Bryobacteraceae bacterium]